MDTRDLLRLHAGQIFAAGLRAVDPAAAVTRALAALPAAGLSLADKQEVSRLLLASGADIVEIITVRKYLSTIKGGQLARAAAPARVVSLILSDVIGDRLDSIASGPTTPDRTTFARARQVLKRRGIWDQVPASDRKHLEADLSDTSDEGDPVFEHVSNVIVGSNKQCLDACVAAAEELGYATTLLASTIEGETRDVARVRAAIARQIVTSGEPLALPCCVVSGGETTVTLWGKGEGVAIRSSPWLRQGGRSRSAAPLLGRAVVVPDHELPPPSGAPQALSRSSRPLYPLALATRGEARIQPLLVEDTVQGRRLHAVAYYQVDEVLAAVADYDR